MSRCRITNPKKLKRIALLLGRSVVNATYRGGHSSPELGHYFSVLCGDGTFHFVSSKLDKYETSDEVWDKEADGSYRLRGNPIYRYKPKN